LARHRITSLNSRLVIYAGIAGGIAVAITKFGAALFTGSSAMMSEGVHTLVDTGNSALLLYGMHRAGQKPDGDHPLGYSREIYFWSFIVAVLVFALGAGLSFYEGVSHIRHPEAIQDPGVNYIVLAISALFDVPTFWLALRNFKGDGDLSTLFGKFKDSKDPTEFTTFFENAATVLGLITAAAGIYLSVLFNRPELDGVASLVISAVLAITAILLARETKGLLIGEPADEKVVESITRIARSIPDVIHANGILTTQLGPDQIIATLSIEFADRLRTSDIEQRVVDLERRVKARHSEVMAVFIKPQTAAEFQRVHRAKVKAGGPAEH